MTIYATCCVVYDYVIVELKRKYHFMNQNDTFILQERQTRAYLKAEKFMREMLNHYDSLWDRVMTDEYFTLEMDTSFMLYLAVRLEGFLQQLKSYSELLEDQLLKSDRNGFDESLSNDLGALADRTQDLQMLYPSFSHNKRVFHSHTVTDVLGGDNRETVRARLINVSANVRQEYYRMFSHYLNAGNDELNRMFYNQLEQYRDENEEALNNYLNYAQNREYPIQSLQEEFRQCPIVQEYISRPSPSQLLREWRLGDTYCERDLLKLFDYVAKIEMINEMKAASHARVQHVAAVQEHPVESQMLTAYQQGIFDIAKRMGFITKKNDYYQWNLSNSLLEYFVGRLFCDDEPVEKDSLTFWKKGGSKTLPSSRLNTLFNKRNIGKYRTKQLRASAIAPEGHEKIDALFADEPGTIRIKEDIWRYSPVD